jgi:intein-encoded DNA endonuclease-like protein
MDFKTMSIDDIIAWCKANDQVEWLKAEAAKTFPIKFKDEDGNIYVDEKKRRKISHFEIKKDFCKMFMPDIMPKKKPKAKTMWDKIAEL